jgi:hypothetical protein
MFPDFGKYNCFTPNNSNVRFRWKADIQVEDMIGCKRPKTVIQKSYNQIIDFR